MQTIAEKQGGSGQAAESPAKVPRKPLQAKIDEPLIDRTKMVALRKRCDVRDIVTLALEQYLPGAEIELGIAK